MQVYQESFPDAFAALLDLPPGDSHPKVYMYCLEEAVHAGGQLSHVLMPAHQVKMDSSVPWDILSVDAFKVTAGITSNVQLSPLKGDQDQMLHECSGLETGPRCDETDFPGTNSNMTGQPCRGDVELFLKDDLMTSPVSSPVFDPFSLCDDNEEHHNRFQEDLLALGRMLQLPDSDSCD
jgi:hypothetical protein